MKKKTLNLIGFRNGLSIPTDVKFIATPKREN